MLHRVIFAVLGGLFLRCGAASADVISTLLGPDFIPQCIQHHLQGSLTLDADDIDGYDSAENVYVYLKNEWGAVKSTAGEQLLTSQYDRMTSVSWGGGPFDVSDTYQQNRTYCVETHTDYVIRKDFNPSATMILWDVSCADAPTHDDRDQF